MSAIFNTSIIRGASLNASLRYATKIGKTTSSETIALGSHTFSVQTGLSIAVGNRVRASLVDDPLTDPTQFIEGPISSYSGTSLVVTADKIGGVVNSVYASWQLTVATDLTGGTFDAYLQMSPETCSGRNRSAIPLEIVVLGSPTDGVFTIYLSPAATAVLALGDYELRVLFTPSGSSDKLEVVIGTISVTD